MDNLGCITQEDGSDSVSSGLNLWLKLKEPKQMEELLGKINASRKEIYAALKNLHYVHFARFVPTPDMAALQVITSFDGEFDAYVMDFVLAIGDQFDSILGYIEDHPPLSVRDHPAEFLDFICRHNLGLKGLGGGGIGMYSAYEQSTVIDITGASGVGRAMTDPTPVSVTRADVQANILRGVDAAFGWHAGFRIESPPGARAFLAQMLKPESDLRISSDATWAIRPPYFLNVGFTFQGLCEIGISEVEQAAFGLAHKAFTRGPDDPDAAERNGDVDDSNPAYWAFGGSNAVHLVVSIHANSEEQLANWSDKLLVLARLNRLALVNKAWVGNALPAPNAPDQHVVHFGYVDGLSHPVIATTDAPARTAGETLPRANVGEFLLGSSYPNVFGGRDSLGGLSPALGQNATFAAFKILQQDVTAFEALLDDAEKKYGMPREWFAAKIMGRWRDGTPVSKAPGQQVPKTSEPVNDFDYLPTDDHKGTPDDSEGMRCPIGAHIRRMNPRSSIVAGRPHSRRLLRRGMPYGLPFDPKSADDGVPRGLIGIFMCADLDRQFEFILRQWAQGGRATTGLVGQQDPVVGSQRTTGGMTGQYRIPLPNGGEAVLDMPRLVQTIGCVYLFMPGLAGLALLAVDASEEKSFAQPFFKQLNLWLEGNPTPPDPETFDPRVKEFRDDPFKYYAWFRDHAPVVTLPKMKSTWVFSHQHVAEVANSLTKFRKRKGTNDKPSGLLNMDPDPHTHCRAEIGVLFQQALAATAPGIGPLVASTYASCRNQVQAKPLEWMSAFAKPVARSAFFELMGLPQEPKIVAGIEKCLEIATPAPSLSVDLQLAVKFVELAKLLIDEYASQAIPGRLYHGIQQMARVHDETNNKPLYNYSALQVEQTANALTVAMAGFLPLQWFIALATWRLLLDDGALLQQLRTDESISNKEVVDELLRIDMSAPLSDRYVINNNTVLGGVTLNKDDRITLSFTAANHDPLEYGPDADKVNFKRQKKGPGFGLGYPNEHSCLGHDLVYLVMEPVIEALRTADPAPRLKQGFAPAWGAPGQFAMFRAMGKLDIHC